MIPSRTRALLISLACLVLLSSGGLAHAEAPGAWTATTNYPSQLAGIGCAVVGQDVYCVGGFDSNYNSYDDSYYAPLGATGIGAWASGSIYPTAVDSASCVSSNLTIYCIGGEEDDGQTVLNDVYYTQVSPTTLAPGAWSAAASFDQPTAATSCVVSGGYVYCVGGFGSSFQDFGSTWYAPVGSAGIDSWKATTDYPKGLDSESCAAYQGYIYCVGGEVGGGSSPTPINNVYYAQLTSSGIGKWSAGPAYPASLAALSCDAYSGYIYCVGGYDVNGLSYNDVYYAPISSSGMGAWVGGTAYPTVVDTSACFSSGSYMYCVGGVNENTSTMTTMNEAYFVSLGSSSTTPEFPVAAAIPVMLGGFLGAVALGLRRRRA